MKGNRFYYMLLAVLCVASFMAGAQENPAPAQDGTQTQAPNAGPGGAGWQHRFRTTNMASRVGEVTEVASDHLVIKTYAGEVVQVNVIDGTRISDGTVHVRAAESAAGEENQSRPMPMGGYTPHTLKLSDIAVGDYVTTVGEMPPGQEILNASMIARLDPERVKEMKARNAAFGKTWLMGKVTSIDGTKLTLTGTVDNLAHTFMVDDNTSFLIHRMPATLADVHVDGLVRMEGSLVNGVFVAKTVTVMSGGRMGGRPMSNGGGWPVPQGQPTGTNTAPQQQGAPAATATPQP